MQTTRALAVALFTVFIALLVYDRVHDAESTIEFESHQPDRDYHANMSFSNVQYQPETRSVTATLNLTIVASRPGLEIHDVAFSYAVEPDGGMEWRYLSSCTDVERGEVTAGTAGPRIDMASLDCGDVTLPMAGERHPEFWYPFDSYGAALDLRACVTSTANACLDDDNLVIQKVRFDVIDPNVVARVNGELPKVTLRVERKFFVRMVSVIFLIMGVVFLGYFLLAAGSHDMFTKSLGFFAAFWGLRTLIVPATVKLFPTVVDYSVLTLFVSLFAAVLYKLPRPEEEGSNEPNSSRLRDIGQRDRVDEQPAPASANGSGAKVGGTDGCIDATAAQPGGHVKQVASSGR